MKTRILASLWLLVFSAAVSAQGNLWERKLEERHEQRSEPLEDQVDVHFGDTDLTASERKRLLFDNPEHVIQEYPPGAGYSASEYRSEHQRDKSDTAPRASDYKQEMFGS